LDVRAMSVVMPVCPFACVDALEQGSRRFSRPVPAAGEGCGSCRGR
jgi:hypothetical protein